jgi:hypothetical protein
MSVPYSSTNSEDQFHPVISFIVRFNEPAAGPWSRSFGAADFVRLRLLRYGDEEVLPRFGGYF